MDPLCAHNSCVSSAFQGLSNGISYGAKVRFTHSVVMSILFSSGSLCQQFLKILKNTKDHSLQLGSFVFLFKSIVCILTNLRQKSSSLNHAISGFIAGIVWSQDTAVNSQVALYLFSRNIVGHTKLLNKKKLIKFSEFVVKNSFVITTVLCWAVVMTLYETFPDSLQISLTSSMKFLYSDSDNWKGWRHCVPYCDEFLKLIEKF